MPATIAPPVKRRLFNFKATPAEIEQIHAVAASRGLSAADLIRQSLVANGLNLDLLNVRRPTPAQ
jgi:hypothetical protein